MSEQKLRPLPIGVSNWADLRSKDYLVVDKTAFLPSILSKHKVFIARPPHMGKTTLCSMLEALFTHGVPAFAGTQLPTGYLRNLGPYPVIKLSLREIAGDDWDSFAQSLRTKLIEAYAAVGLAEEVAKVTSPNDDFRSFLYNLKIISSKHDLVFLIDDWDHPLSSSLGDKSKYHGA